VTKTAISGTFIFRGLMLVQITSLLVTAALAALMAGGPVGLAALWGGAICLLAHAWAGFQIWLHPRNQEPRHQAGAAIRAELGKIAIMLLLFWLSFREWPDLRGKQAAAALLISFFVVQAAGWVWLARATGGPPPQGPPGNKEG
jgi:ATP synthase protein I